MRYSTKMFVFWTWLSSQLLKYTTLHQQYKAVVLRRGFKPISLIKKFLYNQLGNFMICDISYTDLITGTV
jgi:hypothetical protein